MKPSRDPRARPPDAAAVATAADIGPVSLGIFRVARLHRMIAGHLLREVGLHTGQELVMMELWQTGPQRQADLIRALDSDAATMTRTIKRLEHAGFVRRVPTPTDRRASLIEPTPASLPLRQKVESIWAALEDATIGGLAATERDRVAASLSTLEERLRTTAMGYESERPRSAP